MISSSSFPIAGAWNPSLPSPNFFDSHSLLKPVMGKRMRNGWRS
jgi:hypothetical protein